MELSAGSKSKFEDGGAVGERIHHGRGHIVRRTVYDEVAKPGLALEEGAVEGAARIKRVETREERRPSRGEEILSLFRKFRQ